MKTLLASTAVALVIASTVAQAHFCSQVIEYQSFGPGRMFEVDMTDGAKYEIDEYPNYSWNNPATYPDLFFKDEIDGIVAACHNGIQITFGADCWYSGRQTGYCGAVTPIFGPFQ